MRFPCLRYDFALPSFLLRFNSASKPFQLPFIEWDLHGICNGFTTDLQRTYINAKTQSRRENKNLCNFASLRKKYIRWTILSTQFAAFTFIQFSSETLLYEMTKTITERFYLYSVNHLTNKGILKQGTSLFK